VLHYQRSAAWGPTTLLGLANAAVTKWNSNNKARSVATLSLVEVKATDLTTQTSGVAFADTGLPVVGTLSGTSVPNNVTVVVTKRTAARGRSYRGRIYHCALAQTEVVANIIAPATVGALITVWTQWLTLSDGIALTDLVVISRFQGGAPLGAGIATEVTGFTCDGVADSHAGVYRDVGTKGGYNFCSARRRNTN